MTSIADGQAQAAFVESRGRRAILDFPLRNIGVLICLFALLKPSLVELYSGAFLACRLISLLVFVWMLYRYFSSHILISTPLALFILFRLSFLLPTVANGGDVLNWGYTTLGQVSLFAFVEWEMRQGGRRTLDFLCLLRVLLAAYLVVNCMMVLTGVGGVERVQSDGEITKWYLLGIRTRVTDCFFPALMISMVIDALRGERVGIMTIVIVAAGVIQIAILEVATALFGLALFVALYALMFFSPAARRVLNVRVIVLLSILITALVVGLRIQDHFADLLATYCNKSTTLTGRTDIWDSAFGIIAASPISGYGINDSFGAFVPWRGGLWQAHNQWLQLLYDGGIVATALFALFVISCGKQLERLNKSFSVPIKITLLVFMLMMVSEIYTYNMGLFYLVPFVMAELSPLVCELKVTTQKKTMSRTIIKEG